MRLERINPEGVAPPIGSYSQATRVECGDATWVFVSGQMALDGEGLLIGADDLGAQTRQVFENLREILTANGAGFSSVVKIQTFVASMEDLAPSREVRNQYLATDPPTSTTVRVAGLVIPGALIEIGVVAVVSGR